MENATQKREKEPKPTKKPKLKKGTVVSITFGLNLQPRTGSSLSPKLGLASKMCNAAFQM
jgi:hypothetical protein